MASDHFKIKITPLQRIQFLTFLCGLPGLLGCIYLLYLGQYDLKAYTTVIIVGGGIWALFSFRLQSMIIRPLQTASNMLSALREGDFSMRASKVHSEDPLGQLYLEINLLTSVLRSHRMQAREANTLLDKVIEEIDAAVFTFDPNNKLSLSNRYARKIIGYNKESIKEKTASELGLSEALEGNRNSNFIIEKSDRNRRYTTRLGSYRVDGKIFKILILVDVTRTLREEELVAWKRIIRVLGHELNNSMAPIQSIAESLQEISKSESLDEEDRKDITEGLEVIRTRSEGLNRFMSRYARLAKLPPPELKEIEVHSLIRRVTSLSDKFICQIITPKEKEVIRVDPDQIEQAMINLIKNASEAMESKEGMICIHWEFVDEYFHLYIDDEGPGISNTDNLFVPFFSTKSNGSGIGLTLSRQIIEGHHGSLKLINRPDDSGCRAIISLPLDPLLSSN